MREIFLEELAGLELVIVCMVDIEQLTFRIINLHAKSPTEVKIVNS